MRATPRSVINVAVSPQRRLGTQLLSLARLRAVAARSDATVNDVLLALVGGALRRYLLDMEALPEHTLLGSVPMALPRPDGQPGNAVAGFVCPLGTHLANPRERIALVSRVTRRAKAEMSRMSHTALDQLALLGISPLLLGQMLGVLPKLPPIFNLVVSNVVLSKTPLYLMGARLEAMYPVSFLFDGYGLNVTLVGYCDQVAVGFLGCRNALPRLQRLAIYTAEALEEAERALGLGKQESVAKPNARPKSRKTAKP
jgi:diacylglycerol O-acyltransferase / wax synthase